MFGVSVCLSVRLFQTAHLRFGLSVSLSVCFKRHMWNSACLSFCFKHHIWSSACPFLRLSVCFKKHIWGSSCLSTCLSVSLYGNSELRHICPSVCFKRHVWGLVCLSVFPFVWNGTSGFRHICLSVVSLFQTAHLRFVMSICPSVSNDKLEFRHVCLSDCPSVRPWDLIFRSFNNGWKDFPTVG